MLRLHLFRHFIQMIFRYRLSWRIVLLVYMICEKSRAMTYRWFSVRNPNANTLMTTTHELRTTEPGARLRISSCDSGGGDTRRRQPPISGDVIERGAMFPKYFRRKSREDCVCVCDAGGWFSLGSGSHGDEIWVIGDLDKSRNLIGTSPRNLHMIAQLIRTAI